jgi:PKD repeat protein
MKNLAVLICISILLIACNKKPEANFTWSPQYTKVGQEVQFTNISTDAKKYDWNLGNMKISSETNPKNTYTNRGNYTIDLTAHNGLRSDVKTVKIEVIP